MKCDPIITLYGDGSVVSNSVKFDEYKYAIAQVPFHEKWNLKLVRNAERERVLFFRRAFTFYWLLKLLNQRENRPDTLHRQAGRLLAVLDS